MRQAIILMIHAAILLGAGAAILGAQAMLTIAGGALSVMALIIAATFLWLWRSHATPLALGMAVSWSGLGGVLVALWPGLAHAGGAVLLAPVALCLTGAVLHFAVIHRSSGGHGPGFLWPVAGAFALSFLGWLVA